MEGKIEHSKTSECYTLTINGKFYGNYDTFREAMDAYIEVVEKELVEA